MRKIDFVEYIKTEKRGINKVQNVENVKNTKNVEEAKHLEEAKKCDLANLIDFITKNLKIKFKAINYIKNGVQIEFFKNDTAENLVQELSTSESLKCFSFVAIKKILTIITL